ncbi:MULTISPECIES: 2'-5' RNA ligase family protein [unclassified Deinococcus]|uniref:2'-5' RNA ligase family protein n=1 Tax=unclassified Deinococcus TaxID=2623546 RepID=UPI001C2F7CBC|nr:2'-5' RNA ligase family protein [Deinococcus sp. 43]MDK2014204.1 2'-5' RNA ligase family protein [Deinococcus sp. 43]
MSASHLLALRPPPDIEARIVAFREAHGIRDAAAVPHVTVKARSGLDDDLHWLDLIPAVAAATPPVPVELLTPRVFPNGSALYLPARGPGAVRLHLALLDALRPARRFGYEGPQMTPHLTLALGRRDASLDALLDAAGQAFPQPLIFTATELVWMRKPGPGGAYRPVQSWTLGGTRDP